MTDRERARLRAEAKFDQRWAEMGECHGDLLRIALRLPGDAPREGDDDLTRRAVMLVVAELFRRGAAARELGTEEPA